MTDRGILVFLCGLGVWAVYVGLLVFLMINRVAVAAIPSLKPLSFLSCCELGLYTFFLSIPFIALATTVITVKEAEEEDLADLGQDPS